MTALKPAPVYLLPASLLEDQIFLQEGGIIFLELSSWGGGLECQKLFLVGKIVTSIFANTKGDKDQPSQMEGKY